MWNFYRSFSKRSFAGFFPNFLMLIFFLKLFFVGRKQCCCSFVCCMLLEISNVLFRSPGPVVVRFIVMYIKKTGTKPETTFSFIDISF